MGVRINSADSMATANNVFRAFKGSWAEAERKAVRSADGVLEIRRSALSEAKGSERTARRG